MLNPESVAVVEAARFGARFVRPLYDTYGFARIPATIERLLTGAGGVPLPPAALAGLAPRYDTVILLLIDGLGWRFIAPRAARHPTLRRFFANGVVSRLTTMFPSTTSAHVTTIHSGLDPAASGVFEWHIFHPGLRRMITPLLYSFSGDHGRETLLAANVDPATIFPATSFYQRLAAHGVRSSVYQHAGYAGSPFTRFVTAGAELLAFRTVAEALAILAARVSAEQGPAYHHLYIDTVDAVSHIHGPDAAPTDAEIEAVLTAIERELHQALAALGRPALLLITADHGQIAINPQRALLVDQLLPGLLDATPTGADGRPLLPGGSSRDLFLYVHEQRLDEQYAALSRVLEGRAEVHRTAELIAAGLFGPEPSPEFLARVGNLVVLPYAGETVWWSDRRFPVRFKGSHGGLTEEEAYTQLAALAYG